VNWLTALKGARYWGALALALSLAVGVFGWGYMKGSHAQELKSATKEKAALRAQAKQLKKSYSKQLAALQTKASREAQIERHFSEIQIPTYDTCDAGPDWLRAIQDSLRAIDP
jgi:uncharacterized protein HemX